MKLLAGIRFQRTMIFPILWITLWAPSHNSLYFAPIRISRSMNTGNRLLLSKLNIYDSIPNPLKNSISESKGEVNGIFDGDQRDVLRRFPTIDDTCRKMLPQESFEFRLQRGLDYRIVPHVTSTPPIRVEQGLAYYITDAELLSLDEDIRTFIEDDDRYTLDWGDWETSQGRNVIVFMPRDSNESRESDADSSALVEPNRRPTNQSRLLSRIRANLPRLILYTVQIFGSLLYPILVVIEQANSAFDTSSDGMAGLTFNTYLLASSGVIQAISGMYWLHILVKKIKKDLED